MLNRLQTGWRERPEIRLMSFRQRFIFAALTAERVIVGCCDLLLAGLMYLLFMLLQGAIPIHHRWWTPTSALSAAFTASVLAVVRAALDLISTRSVVAFVQDLYTDMLLRLTQGYNGLQWLRFTQRNRSELLNYAIATTREACNFYHLAIEVAAGSLVVIMMTGALIYKSPLVACSLGLIGTTFYAMHRLFIRAKLQQAAGEREDSLRSLQRTLADMFTAMREIRSYGIGSYFQDRIRTLARVVGESFKRVAFLPQVARIFTDQGVVLVFLCVVIMMLLRHRDSRQLLSLLVFYFVLCRRLLPLVSQLSFLAGQLENSYKSVLIVSDELKDCFVNCTAEITVQEAPQDLVLEVKQVNFSFGDGARILNNVNLTIRQGETVLLCGASGAGKSSLLNLIAGLLQPISGVVRIRRKSFAYVPQEIVLLDDSIRSNLLFGLPDATDQELTKALAVANLADFVATLPLGLETRAGDNGVLLSVGQRQRIGLARAILRGPRLLLLDEATSALDETTVSNILANLNAANIAVLLVTHRIHREALGWRILHLDEGSLVESTDSTSLAIDPARLTTSIAS